MAVWSNDPDVDPVGACVGMNGARVNAIVEELRGEKIDIINWNENPAMLIENALSPAKVISVIADDEEKNQQKWSFRIISFPLQSEKRDRMHDWQPD